jgi:SSS family transporter
MGLDEESNVYSQMDSNYMGKETYFGGTNFLPQWVGYVIVIGFGAFFSLFTILIMHLERKYVGTKLTSEFFNTAGRDIKMGLTASVIVSQWTWAATLLQSSNVAWQFGVSGPFWYASGATIQVLLFGILAIELKRRAPTCHTVCELVDARWGRTAHKTFIFFSFLTSIIVTSMLLLGGSATINAVAGCDLYLTSFLIPWGVILYTAAGGLKATFLASYVHTSVIFVILLIMVYTIYVKEYSSDSIYSMLEQTVDHSRAECEVIFSKNYKCEGSGADDACGCKKDGTISIQNCLDEGTTGDLDGETWYDDDAPRYACGYVGGNRRGSYLTMLSSQGLMFGIINIIGNFGTVFVDQSYWQSAIAAKPAVAHKGYLLGGMVWFTIPFALATACGISAVALQLPIDKFEAGSGLVPPAVAAHIYGSAGAVLISVMLFMAIVSTGSAESIAVSSICAYDIYRTYFNPAATGADIMRVSRIVIVIYGACMGCLAVFLHWLGLSLGWVYLFMGIVIGSAVVPLWFMMTWKDASATGAVLAAWSGQALAVSTWLIAAKLQGGAISIATLGTNEVMLSANLVAIIISGLIHYVHSKLNPQNYDWVSMSEIKLLDEDRSGLSADDLDPVELEKAKAWIAKCGWGFTILIVVIWPVLSTPAGVFTRDYFAFWVFIALLWGLVASFIIVVLPLWESKDQILAVVDGMFGTHWCEYYNPESARAEFVAKSAKEEVGAPPAADDA